MAIRGNPSRAVALVALALAPVTALVAHDAGAQQPPTPAPSAKASGSGSAAAAPKPGKGAPPLGSASAGSGVGAPKVPPMAKAGPAPKVDELWVSATTDELIGQLEKRAIRDGLAGGRFAIGAIVAIPQLADEARAGLARAALGRVVTALAAEKGKAEAKELAGDAAIISRSIAADTGLPAGRAEDAKLGLVSAWRIAGPFKDTTGTGLDTPEGPEVAVPAKGDKPLSIALFRQLDAQWDDGAYQVEWRSVPPELISARGTPLDVLVYPRREACTYAATAVTLPADGPVVVRVAATGSVRVIFDGATVGRSDEQHDLALADRLAARVETSKGTHLLALKICSGPQGDRGRFRARLTNDAGDPLSATFSDDLQKLPANVTPPKSTPVVTALGRALAVSEKGATVDEALAAALARQLGGADDRRSPKTQGLLDVVVTQNPRPDVLALAGLLAPARGNQTAWLNASLSRSDSDPVYAPVGRFARRALVHARLDAGYVDWAATSVANSELKTATDLDARILRARLLDGLGNDEAAFAAYKAIWDAEGSATPTYVLRAIAAPKFARPLVAAAARAQALTTWPRESARDYVASKRVLGAGEVKAATIASFRLLSSADEIESIASLLHELGLEPEHRRYLGMATVLAPNKKGVFDQLTQALAASPDPKDKAMAKDALMRARSLDPGSPFLRAEETLAFGARAPDDEAFMPEPKVFLARRLPKEKLPTGNPNAPLEVYDRQLDWLRVVTVDDAGRVMQLIHYTREVVKPPKDSSDLDEPHVPAEGDVVEVVRARVHRADGTTAVPQEIDEGDSLRIRWTDLKPGDVVEVATRGYTELPVGDRSAPPFYFMDYGGGPTTHPVLWNEVIVRAPKKRPLYTTVVNADLDKTMQHTTTAEKGTGRTIERYVWPTPITLPEEPLQPKSSEIYPTLIGSQFKTWDDFVGWYKAGIESFASVDPRVKRKAEELIKKAKANTREEKIRAIFNWIADQVKYVNYVSGEQWLPNRPQNVLDRMQGDCDDKAMLLMTMLKAIGIPDAQEVLVQTRYTGMPSVITAKGAVAPLFDHGIAYLPANGKLPERYLDATSPESRIGPLPAMDARASAIRIVPEAGGKAPGGVSTPVVILPSSDPSEHGVDGTWTFKLSPTGSAEVVIDETHEGDSAFFLRSSLKQAASAATWLERGHSIAELPQIEVLPQVKFDGEGAGGRAKLSFQAKSAAFARREGSDLVVKLNYGVPSAQRLAPLPKRVTPIVLPPHLAPSQDTVKLVYTPPPGYKVAELTPGGDVIGGAYGKATLTLEKGPGGSVVVRRTFVLDQHFIPVKEYDAWRSFLLQVDALFRREIRFVKGGA